MGWGSSWDEDDQQPDCNPSANVLDPETLLLGPRPTGGSKPRGDKRMYGYKKWGPTCGPFLDCRNGRSFKLRTALATPDDAPDPPPDEPDDGRPLPAALLGRSLVPLAGSSDAPGLPASLDGPGRPPSAGRLV